MMNKSFTEIAFPFLMKWEGGYVNNPNDPGGETKYGISKRAYPDLNISELTEDDAKEIYFSDYWVPLKCDLIPLRIAVCLFDFGVNSGNKRAVMALQHCINSANPALHENIVQVDGSMGDNTVKFVNKFYAKGLVERYLLARIAFLTRLNKKEFFYGWMKRVVSLMDLIGI